MKKRICIYLTIILAISLSVVLFAAPLGVANAEETVPDTAVEETVDEALANNNTWSANVAKWFNTNMTELFSGLSAGLLFFGGTFGIPYIKKKLKKKFAEYGDKIADVKNNATESSEKVKENYTAVIGVVNNLIGNFNEYMIKVQALMSAEEQRKLFTQQSLLYSKASMDMIREAFAHSDLPKPNITMIELQYANALEEANRLLDLPSAETSEEIKEAV